MIGMDKVCFAQDMLLHTPHETLLDPRAVIGALHDCIHHHLLLLLLPLHHAIPITYGGRHGMSWTGPNPNFGRRPQVYKQGIIRDLSEESWRPGLSVSTSVQHNLWKSVHSSSRIGRLRDDTLVLRAAPGAPTRKSY